MDTHVDEAIGWEWVLASVINLKGDRDILRSNQDERLARALASPC